MGRDDSYYSDHVVDDSGARSIALDPRNGVAKLLQRRLNFGEPLGELGPFVVTTVESCDDHVAEGVEHRQVFAAVLGRTVSPQRA